MFNTYFETISYKHQKITDVNNDIMSLIYKFTVDNYEDITVYYNQFENFLKNNNDITYENYDHYQNKSYIDLIAISNKLKNDELDDVEQDEKYWCDYDNIRSILDDALNDYVNKLDISTIKKIINLYGFDKALDLYIYYKYVSADWFRYSDIKEYCNNIKLEKNSNKKLKEMVFIIFCKKFNYGIV